MTIGNRAFLSILTLSTLTNEATPFLILQQFNTVGTMRHHYHNLLESTVGHSRDDKVIASQGDNCDRDTEYQNTPLPKLIMDIPPTPGMSHHNDYPKQQTKQLESSLEEQQFHSKKSNPAHKEGPLSPLVHAASSVLGPDQLNKLRAEIITLHSDIIKSFVDTSDSAFGKSVLRQLFLISDKDNSGYLDFQEVCEALKLLGFRWLEEEKHVRKIFERADLNDDGEISIDEFMKEAPRTLRVNLVKLAKNNGADLGLLV